MKGTTLCMCGHPRRSHLNTGTDSYAFSFGYIDMCLFRTGRTILNYQSCDCHQFVVAQATIPATRMTLVGETGQGPSGSEVV